MAETAEPLKIQVGEGAEARTITCRRPTHGELDLAMLGRLLQVVIGYQRKIAALEESPEDGAALRVANLLAICGGAIDEVRQRVRKALAVTAPTDALEWLDAGDELARARRAIDVA